MRLKNRVAIITGATGDIGRSTAKKFLSEGAKVMLAGRSEEKLMKLQDELNQDINELSQETDSLVEEIDKWQT